MRRFYCQCEQEIFFENGQCTACGFELGFDPATLSMVAIRVDGGALQTVSPSPKQIRRCANYEQGACNWLIDATAADTLCRACRHNHTIPDLSKPGNIELWRAFESAKRRLFYALLSFGVPIPSREEDPEHGLAFDCVDDEIGERGDAKRAMTGHDNGLITIALAEADPVRREAARQKLGETYRTLLGHLRHEIGHYYWDTLVQSQPAMLERCRTLFGDDQLDYGEALKQHYSNGPRPDWQSEFVTPYAAAHPWEDFAETWQHFMHIVDTLETASAYRVAVDGAFAAGGGSNPYRAGDMERLVAAWTPLTIAINSLNRSMGQPDLYPFVLPIPAIDKLNFIRELIAGSANPLAPPPAKA